MFSLWKRGSKLWIYISQTQKFLWDRAHSCIGKQCNTNCLHKNIFLKYIMNERPLGYSLGVVPSWAPCTCFQGKNMPCSGSRIPLSKWTSSSCSSKFSSGIILWYLHIINLCNPYSYCTPSVWEWMVPFPLMWQSPICCFWGLQCHFL